MKYKINVNTVRCQIEKDKIFMLKVLSGIEGGGAISFKCDMPYREIIC